MPSKKTPSGDRRSGQKSILALLAERTQRVPCDQHPTAPVIGSQCGGCTVVSFETQRPKDIRSETESMIEAQQREAVHADNSRAGRRPRHPLLGRR
ncbi:hypothetical protein ACFZC3_15265 [Streptomyces sp. NPDC007903]|uniref:hypothetical protein n=1 Tax=Streptomyces sp. NPDC007903 TaxID=3364786 RepID=UPI0036E4BFAF